MDTDSFCFSLDVFPAVPLDEGLAETGLGIGGTFAVECYDRDGNLRWRDRAKNMIVNGALDNILSVYFNAAAATTAFYMGMIDNSGYTALAAGDTMSSHTSWVENTNTSNTTRPQWTPLSEASQAIANSSAVQFTMNPSGTCTIRGFFLATNSTLGGTTGTLIATALLGTPQTCNNGDVLKVTYTVNATSS